MEGVTVIADVLSDAAARMDRAVEAAKEDFATVRTGRANPRSSRRSWSTTTARRRRWRSSHRCSNPEARTLLVTPYDKSALKEIEQAIRDTPNLGANPTNDGNLVRVTLPELTEERRREFVKIVRGKGEDAKVHVRNIRRKSKDDLDDLKSEFGDDEVARGEKELDALTKRARRRHRRGAEAQRSRTARGLTTMTDASGDAPGDPSGRSRPAL